jgi:pimeloyl-ACP methyl ester carboxylesterase
MFALLDCRLRERNRRFWKWGLPAGWVAAVAVLVSCVGLRTADGGEAARPVQLPQPVDVTGNDLKTADNVLLKATFFPGSKGKDSVPVILLHSWKGSRKEYVTLAMALWQAGHAVLVPDLRGHGQSTEQVGNPAPLSATRLNKNDFALMAEFDMETLKSFLAKKNNAGELNLEKLCLVGAEMGASVAMNWALRDWSWPQYPGIKQGQHVKAVVLLSPQRNFKGLGMEEAIRNPLLNRFLSIYIMVGSEDSKALSQADAIYASLSRFHPEPEEGHEQDKSLFFKGFDTKAQGTKLFTIRNLGVEQRIVKFVELRLLNKDYPWAETGKKPGEKGK